MIWLGRVGRAAIRGLASLRYGGSQAVSVCVALAAVSTLLACVWLVRHNLAPVTQSWARGANMVVYLDDGVAPERIDHIERALRGLAGVEQVVYVSPDDAAERMRATFGPDSELARGLEPSMLSPSLEVALSDGLVQVAAAHPLIERLRQSPGVDEVTFAGDWLARVSEASRAVSRALDGAVALTGAVWLCLIVVALRLRHGTGPQEGQVWQLVGASPWFERGPQAVAGAVLGALGVGLGLIVSAIVYANVRGDAQRALTEWFGPVELHFASAGDVMRLLLVAAVAGAAVGATMTGRGRDHALA